MYGHSLLLYFSQERLLGHDLLGQCVDLSRKLAMSTYIPIISPLRFSSYFESSLFHAG